MAHRALGGGSALPIIIRSRHFIASRQQHLTTRLAPLLLFDRHPHRDLGRPGRKLAVPPEGMEILQHAEGRFLEELAAFVDRHPPSSSAPAAAPAHAEEVTKKDPGKARRRARFADDEGQ